jgi:hypothetical protein
MTVVPSGDRSTFVYGRGDYGAEYAGDLVRIVEQGNCVKDCAKSDPKDRGEFGPGGNCIHLANLFVGLPIPEFDPRPDGIVCEVYESDEITAPLWPEPLGENP